MSTKATVRIRNVGKNLDALLLIGCDGYPSGVAEAFRKALTAPGAGTLATKLIRANRHAELIAAPCDLAHIEWQYEVAENETGAAIVAFSPNQDGAAFVGTLQEFTAADHEQAQANHKLLEAAEALQ